MVGLVRAISRNEKSMGQLAAELGDDNQPVIEYARLRAKLGDWNGYAGTVVAAAAPPGCQRGAVVVASR